MTHFFISRPDDPTHCARCDGDADTPEHRACAADRGPSQAMLRTLGNPVGGWEAAYPVADA